MSISANAISMCIVYTWIRLTDIVKLKKKMFQSGAQNQWI